MTSSSNLVSIAFVLISISVQATESKLFSGNLIEYKSVLQPGMSFKYPSTWTVADGFTKIPEGSSRSEYVDLKLPIKNGPVKSERHLSVNMTAQDKLSAISRQMKSPGIFTHSFDKTVEGNQVMVYQQKDGQSASWQALVLCDPGTIRVSYSLPMKEVAALKIGDRSIPAELDDFISHIVCKDRPPEKK